MKHLTEMFLYLKTAEDRARVTIYTIHLPSAVMLGRAYNRGGAHMVCSVSDRNDL